MHKDVLVCQDLSVQYRRGNQTFSAVQAVSFAIREGETFGLIGGSGCGKSTILRVLAGLDAHWQGDLHVLGTHRRHGERPPPGYPRLVQMVFQDPYGSLHPRHTVNRSIGEALQVHGFDNVGRRVERALEQVGLDRRFRFRYPHQLSGGQRQRVAIARAIALEPRLLLLDEPTSALDASVQAEILNLLVSLKQALGTSYLLVSHDLGVISHMCDRVAVMQEGRIVEMKDAAQLLPAQVTHPYTQALLANSFSLY